METTQKSTKRIILSRVKSSKNHRIPCELTKDNITNNGNKTTRLLATIAQRRTETPTPHKEPPFLLMRNGIPFLYTPTEIPEYQPDAISPFGTHLKGFKII